MCIKILLREATQGKIYFIRAFGILIISCSVVHKINKRLIAY